MKIALRVITWIVGIVIAVIVAAIIFIAVFNWNHARPWVSSTVGKAIGRPVAINGDLTVNWSRNPNTSGLSHWIPWPRFTAKNVTIANPDWVKGQPFASVPKVQFSIDPFALIAHEISVPMLMLYQPDIDLERDKQGRDNWTFHPEKGKSGWSLKLGDIGFDRGAIKVNDDKLDLHMDIAVTPLGKPIPFAQVARTSAGSNSAPPPRTTDHYEFAWTAQGTYRGAKATGEGKLGSILALNDASLPYPMQVDLHLRDVHIAFTGTLTNPMHLAAMNLQLKVSGDSMANLYPLTGLALPATPPFSASGHLTGNIHANDSVFHYDDFNGKVGASDLHGALTYTTQPPRPKLSGNLASNVLRFADLAPLIGADSNAEKTKRGQPFKQPADKLLPQEPFDTSRWSKMDADITFTGKRIERSKALPVNNLSTHLVMNDGELTLDPLHFGVAGGSLKSSIDLNGRADPMKGRLKLGARGIEMKKLLPTVQLMQTSSGTLNGYIALSGTGNSVAALLGSSNGEIKVLMNGGEVSDTLMEEAGLNIANVIIDKVFGDKPQKVNCLAADFVARDGVLNTRLLALDTQDATIYGHGTINLKTEQIDLTISPHSKGVRVLSLRSPLYLRGTLKNPDAGVEKGPLLARGIGAAVLGTLAAPLAALAALVQPSHDKPDECGIWIEHMRRKPTAPPPGKTMPKKAPIPQPSHR